MMVGWLICGGSGREVTQAGLGVSSFVQACPAGLQCREQLSKPALSFSRASIREPCPLGSAVTVQRESSQVCITEGHGRRRHTLLGLLGRHLYARGRVGCAEGTRRGCRGRRMPSPS